MQNSKITDASAHTMMSSMQMPLMDTMPAAISKKEHSKKSIIDTLRSDERFSMLVSALEKTKGLTDDLTSGKDITFFAPTNTAMEWMQKDMKHGDMEHTLRYHCCPKRMEWKDMRDGMTLDTHLKLDTLKGDHQRIRVFRCGSTISLNMWSRIIEHSMGASNGLIHAVDRMLCPPMNMWCTLNMFPAMFSTWLLAVERCGMAKDMKDTHGLTCFVPTNSAWKNMGPTIVSYLFSEHGMKDLKHIVAYHMSPELAYSDMIVEKKEMKMKSMLKDEKMVVRVSKMNCSMMKMGDCGRCECVSEKKEGGMNPNCYRMSMNEGEARVIFKDGLCSNGNLFALSDVMVPENVRLGEHM